MHRLSGANKTKCILEETQQSLRLFFYFLLNLNLAVYTFLQRYQGFGALHAFDGL